MPAELQFLADGISWGTRGTSSVAALEVQVLSPVPPCVPWRLSASAAPLTAAVRSAPVAPMDARVIL